jgi:lipooligosaccharide transport system ATP-binding protein
MGEIVIRVENVNKSFGNLKAVNNFSFNVEKADCFGLLGPNGAGKTTMMKIIYGKALRDNIDKSVVNVFGYDPGKNELEIKSFSGVVPQEDNLDTELNVRENLMIYARFYGISKKIAMERIESLLEFMELTEKIKSRVDDLSGGMKRRLTIARALINNPKLLILDEPTTGLDPQVRHIIWDKLRKLKKEGVTILLTTHYMDEAFEICDQIIIMDQGGKVMEGKPRDLIAQNIEKYALQVLNKRRLECLNGFLKVPIVRKDESEEMALFYSNDMKYLEEMAECLETGEFYIRQSNLEDLFLKATGRGLNEEQ